MMYLDWAVDPAFTPRIIQALAADLSDLQGEIPEVSFSRAENVAHIGVRGILMPEPSPFMCFFGEGSDYAGIGRAAAEAEADPSITEVRFTFDSPGGAITGVRELAAQIHGMTTPTVAVVTGTCASAAYWLAAACDRIESSTTGVLGCIGCMRLMQADDPRTVKFVSSQTPNKAAGPHDEAASQYQVLCDGFAEQFLGDLAAFRQQPLEGLAAAFGSGDVILAPEALNRNMIDALVGPEILGSMALSNPGPSAQLQEEAANMPFDKKALAEKSQDELIKIILEQKSDEKTDEKEEEAEDGAEALPETADPESEERVKDKLPEDQASAVASDIEINKLRAELAAQKRATKLVTLRADSAQAAERTHRIDELIKTGRIGADDTAKATAEHLYSTEMKAVENYAIAKGCDLATAASAQRTFRLFSDMEARPAGASSPRMAGSTVAGVAPGGTLDAALSTSDGIEAWCDKHIAANAGCTFTAAMNAFELAHPAEHSNYIAGGAK